MNIPNELETIFQQNTSVEGYFDPSNCKMDCASFLVRKCEPAGELDPRVRKKALDACNAYGYAGKRFSGSGYQAAGEGLLMDGWNKFGLLQRHIRGQQIYKAGIAAHLSDIYYSSGDKGAALRWALLAQAEDALVSHFDGGAKHRLETILGMGQPELHAYNNIASENMRALKNDGQEDWSESPAFAEDVLMRFALKFPEYSHLLAQNSRVVEFPLSQAYFSALVDRIDAPTSAEKGHILEDIASYLFLLIPGWIPRRNILEETSAFETDMVVSNLILASNLRAELLGRDFLVECKNWKKSVGTNQVGYFLYRMRLTHTKFGIIFAKKNITGEKNDNEDKRAAASLIRKAFHEDGNICIVIDYSDIKRLAGKETLFWSLLLERINRVRFGKSIYSSN